MVRSILIGTLLLASCTGEARIETPRGEAATADEAIGLVGAGLTPDALFTDVRMPGHRDGLGLAKELKAAFPDLIVFVASGHVDATTGTEVAREVLRKPYDPDGWRDVCG